MGIAILERNRVWLELSYCAVSGSSENLSHVSPKTGRAVCYEVAGPWKDKLLKLPKFLSLSNDLSDISISEALEGLALSGYFFELGATAIQSSKHADSTIIVLIA